MLSQVFPVPLSNGCADIYLYDLDDAPVFEEMVSSNKTLNPINTYFLVTPSVA